MKNITIIGKWYLKLIEYIKACTDGTPQWHSVIGTHDPDAIHGMTAWVARFSLAHLDEIPLKKLRL